MRCASVACDLLQGLIKINDTGALKKELSHVMWSHDLCLFSEAMKAFRCFEIEFEDVGTEAWQNDW